MSKWWQGSNPPASTHNNPVSCADNGGAPVLAASLRHHRAHPLHSPRKVWMSWLDMHCQKMAEGLLVRTT